MSLTITSRFAIPPVGLSRGIGTDGFQIVGLPEGQLDLRMMTLIVDINSWDCASKGLRLPGDSSVRGDTQTRRVRSMLDQGKFITGGRWPFLIPATYAEGEGGFGQREEFDPY